MTWWPTKLKPRSGRNSHFTWGNAAASALESSHFAFKVPSLYYCKNTLLLYPFTQQNTLLCTLLPIPHTPSHIFNLLSPIPRSTSRYSRAFCVPIRTFETKKSTNKFNISIESSKKNAISRFRRTCKTATPNFQVAIQSLNPSFFRISPRLYAKIMFPFLSAKMGGIIQNGGDYG